MTPEHCATIADALETMPSLEEVDAFAEALRNPPPGTVAKPVTEAEWALIARYKITLQKDGAKRK